MTCSANLVALLCVLALLSSVPVLVSLMPVFNCWLSQTQQACLILQIFCYQSLQLIERCTQTVLEAGGSFAGVNRKVQLKPTKWTEPEEGSTEQPRVVEALLILKHGGVLTHAGRQQVRHLTYYQDSAHPEARRSADTCWQAAGASSDVLSRFCIS